MTQTTAMSSMIITIAMVTMTDKVTMTNITNMTSVTMTIITAGAIMKTVSTGYCNLITILITTGNTDTPVNITISTDSLTKIVKGLRVREARESTPRAHCQTQQSTKTTMDTGITRGQGHLVAKATMTTHVLSGMLTMPITIAAAMVMVTIRIMCKKQPPAE